MAKDHLVSFNIMEGMLLSMPFGQGIKDKAQCLGHAFPYVTKEVI
jgi:hypothetical protein